METIIESNGYKVEYNGGATYFLIDSTGECYGTYGTERKAKNALKRTLKRAGLE